MATKLNIGLADEIQMIYPQAPDWDVVPDAVLMELVRTYFQEPSCATTAIGLLGIRNNPAAKELANWLLDEEDADQWLKQTARRVLDNL